MKIMNWGHFGLWPGNRQVALGKSTFGSCSKTWNLQGLRFLAPRGWSAQVITKKMKRNRCPSTKSRRVNVCQSGRGPQQCSCQERELAHTQGQLNETILKQKAKGNAAICRTSFNETCGPGLRLQGLHISHRFS